MPLWGRKTSIKCEHMMWRGQNFEGHHKVVLWIWRCFLNYTSSMRQAVRLSVRHLGIKCLQIVLWVVLPKFERLPSTHELPLLAELRPLSLKHSALHWQWCCSFQIHNSGQPNCGSAPRCGVLCAIPAPPLALGYSPFLVSCRFHLFEVSILHAHLGFNPGDVYYFK